MDRVESRKRIAHEFKELMVVFLFLAPFFISAKIYRMYLSGESGDILINCGTALVAALVLSKVILIGELAKLGGRSENKPLIVSTIHKALMFTALYLVFHILEDATRDRLHGRAFMGSVYQSVTDWGALTSRALFMFFAFIPFFALREIRRVMGAEAFRNLFFGKRRPSDLTYLGSEQFSS